MNHSTETPTKPGYYAWASSKTDGWKLAKVYFDVSKKVLLFDSTFNPFFSVPTTLRSFTQSFVHGELKWRKLYTEEEVQAKIDDAMSVQTVSASSGLKGQP